MIDEGDFKRILVGVDDSADAQMGFKYAIRLAQRTGATLIITSILENGELNIYQALNKNYLHDQREELVKHIEVYKQRALKAGVKTVEAIVEEGDPGVTIVKKVIPVCKADLLVIGSNAHEKKGMKRYFGSQAEYLAKNSPIPIMIVR